MIKNSIICPLFNRFDLTQRFISQIKEYLTDEDELILVDNNSSDNTLAGLSIIKKQINKNIIIISNEKNWGFGTANNVGAKIAKGNNLLFISNDVEISGDFIRIYQNNMDRDNLFGARLISFDTSWNLYCDIETKEMKHPIPYLEGWSLGIHAGLFESIGRFDENIFIDGEDLDLSYTINDLGYGLKQLDLPLKHEHPGSSFINQNRLQMTYDSLNYFMDKRGLERLDGKRFGE